MQSHEHGIAPDEAARRLAEHGPNQLPLPERRSGLIRFLGQFHNVLVYVLLTAALATASLGHWIDTSVILAVVIGNAIIGFVQKGRAETAMQAIRAMLSPQASVLRGGERIGVDAAELVPGDVVLLEAGDKVPTDLRLLALKGLLVQAAILTGESVPVEKATDSAPADAVLGDRMSMAFCGTLIAVGMARGVVMAAAGQTQIGLISGLLGRVKVLTTPLVEQMNRFARWLTVLILLISASILKFGYCVGHIPFSDQFMALVSLAVAAIPKGLTAVLKIALSVGVQAMAKRHAIVRRLPAIETIGAVSVICTDKTGTLTRNEMVVVQAVTPTARFAITGEGYTSSGTIEPAPEGDILRDLGLAATLCNDASLTETDDEWRVAGDPMEVHCLPLQPRPGSMRRVGSGRTRFRSMQPIAIWRCWPKGRMANAMALSKARPSGC